jgi:hypothetical protein
VSKSVAWKCETTIYLINKVRSAQKADMEKWQHKEFHIKVTKYVRKYSKTFLKGLYLCLVRRRLSEKFQN